ncbi:MAG: serine/threonine-protein kinase [Acidobacteriota bacterium]|nr:serine/threonine-protein kinase [Acidobacteriota bacterium]
MEQLFHGAVGLPAEEREAFLDRECPEDPEMRAGVVRLLESAGGAFLEIPAVEAAAPALAAEARFSPGAHIGPYEIVALLGEGGMGQVYEARDTRLGRRVALKVLPLCDSLDTGQRNRLWREARAASALNHPNIVTVHDIVAGAGRDALVMEYVAGQTLQERIGRRKGLPLKEALGYAIQIAEALAAAHAAGILHRDIKPGNIMVTAGGAVKVLDFGLARRVRLEPDQTASVTAAGEIAGTPAYMSPEQVEGKPLDPRSDIFSFGAVLYEMVTGRRAFAGESALSTISAVLHDEPKPVGGVPANLQRTIGRCLRKDPDRRYQNMTDLKVELEELREESASQPASAADAPGIPLRRWLWIGAAAALLLAAGVGIGLLYVRPAPPPPRLVRLTTLPGYEHFPSFSPDGKQVAFQWNGENQDNFDVYVKFVGEATALRLTTDPAYDGMPAWSPDGRQIAFVSGRNARFGIYLMSPLGGPQRKVADLVVGGRMSWTPDGESLLAARAHNEAHPADGDGDLVLVPADASSPIRRILAPPNGTWYRDPTLSPDGRTLAFGSCTGGASAPTCVVQVAEVGQGFAISRKPRSVTPSFLGFAGLTWTAGGESLIYSAADLSVSGGQLWRIAAGPGARPERLDLAEAGAVHPAIDLAGQRLAFARATGHSDIWRLEKGGSTSAFMPSSVRSVGAQFAPDGRSIAFESARGGGLPALWIANAGGTGLRPLTDPHGPYSGSPRWSPDGRRVAFDARREGGGWDVWTIEESGGSPRRLTSGPGDNAAPSWSRDGNSVYFASNRSGRFEVWRVPAQGGPAQQVTRGGGHTAIESEDGKTLYYTFSEIGVEGIYAKRLPDGEEKRLVDESVVQRAFAVVSDGVYFLHRLSGNQVELRLYSFTGPKTQVVSTVEGPVFMGLSVSPDRRTFLYSRWADPGSDLMMIENFR